MSAVIAEHARFIGDRTFSLDRIKHAQLLVSPKRGTRDGYPGAIDAPVGVYVDKFDRHSPFGKTDSCRHPANSSANDKRRGDAPNKIRFHEPTFIERRPSDKLVLSIGCNRHNRCDAFVIA